MAGTPRLPSEGISGDRPVIPHIDPVPEQEDGPRAIEKVGRQIIDTDESDWNRRIALHGIPVVPISMPPDYSILHTPEKNQEKKHRRKASVVQVLTRYWDNRAELRQLGKEAEWLFQRLHKGQADTVVQFPPDIVLTGKQKSLKSSANWSGIVESWLAMSATERAKALDRNLKQVIITNDDPRKGLHGQRGAVAARNLDAFTVVGPYVGKYCYGRDLQEEHGLHGVNVGRYTVDCSMETMRLDLCGYGYGNITVCINANTTYRPDDPAYQDNAFFLMVVYQGWPYVFVVTQRPVRKGDELLADYGRYYWLGY
ncbi:hypothetical protein M3P05_02290 [Sansalvadorimonas sp. 2012CJ34-2]|uniref:SET domain-containing protein n=1 Tax=Parendozoicomonas callyspongiae TaxID=2942213 RepID=A0ABT0PBL9_9GAMM|nr:SET domain-containing protein-lysine N-methyltransferase [Sansalvadorimonas sp. 2012CJ34-2]MCL6268779.1 hypothetical protein [Sansalvadorimonas sp. 2012CJ34-2]